MLTSPRARLCLMLGVSALVLAACGRKEAPPAAPEPAATEVPADSPAASPEPAPAAETADSETEAQAGGEAHVHGAGDLAVTVDGNLLTLTLDAPLANFGLGESDTEALEVSTGIGDGLVKLVGEAGCTAGDRHIETRTTGDHSSLTLILTYICETPGKLESVRLNAFSEFPGFSTVDAVFVGPDSQVAAVLTPANPELAIQ